MPDYDDPWEDREAAERREMYEDRTREAIDTLRADVEEERLEIERLHGLLAIARNAVQQAGLRAKDAGRLALAEAYNDALRRSDPDATPESGT